MPVLFGPSTPAAVATRRPSEGSVHSWDLSTGVDGPGTRFVTFLSGRPLTCQYRHNTDTPAFSGELLHRMERELRLHTALDTSGFLGARATDALLRDVDLVPWTSSPGTGGRTGR
ncbi:MULTISPECIES: hypothetical protein [unclassified Streptomyces]|uniref:hypothetical protein n=1 Tax=unclassified Streptomyces TaxID=2593676 RepID=UPI002E11DEFA|nr:MULTISPECIES: hypothetical protein [unclassified Streptomyces]